ncbi:MAG: TRAM domain-containing protein, partial [Oscillospiraceae bacterium]|nr:TRAM domain-containing protein [Oscillospiraceae bacterium]
KGGEGTLTGKSREFIIVNFRGDSSLTGNFVKVKITGARNWALDGELAD